MSDTCPVCGRNSYEKLSVMSTGAISTGNHTGCIAVMLDKLLGFLEDKEK